jgi:hypothetical protein
LFTSGKMMLETGFRQTIAVNSPNPCNIACYNFAFTGGTDPYDDYVQSMFQAIGANTIALHEAALAEVPNDGRRALARQYYEEYMNAAAGMDDDETGEQAAMRIMNDLVRRAIAYHGLQVSAEPEPKYYVCMHGPIARGVNFDHWWLEISGVTVEVIPAWADIHIYKPRRDEANTYFQIRVPIVELAQAHIDRIARVVSGGYKIQTPPYGAYGFGWS